MAATLIYCAVLEDEVEALLRGSGLRPTLRKMPQGLHQDPPKLRQELQTAIDEVESDSTMEAIILGYGLCSRGSEGLTSRRCTLILPRAHDCITLLLGSREAYNAQMAKCPGTYWYSPGWNRHHLPPGEGRYLTLLNQYKEQYGEDNAEYLMEEEQTWYKTYSRAAFVHQEAGDVLDSRAQTRSCAEWLGWEYDEIVGNPDLLRTLLEGPWDEERFAVARPGQTFRLAADSRVVEVVDAD